MASDVCYRVICHWQYESQMTNAGRQVPRGIPAYQTPKRHPDGHSGHRRVLMEMPETELTATKRPVWNAGRTVGAKRALKPKQI